MDFVGVFGFSDFEVRRFSKFFFINSNMYFFLIQALIVLLFFELKKQIQRLLATIGVYKSLSNQTLDHLMNC